ncbi:class I SAM-dependent methyltransferase [Thermogladius calderae]|uniref:class I SAM-dependent methyltransferase n=1 Tax=Thermogladius calderae TaxID=1200300 RepID=UPI00064F8DE0|nr:class I SAM-dependent methyltransferase family protein [Thermogladius calderae]
MSRGKILRKLASETLGEELASKLWGRIEFVGDIALIRIPPGIEADALKQLAERILEEFKYVKSVWGGHPGVQGEYRLRKYVHLAGEPRSETVYKEHGCLFKVDITKVYVSPVLGYEHKRVAGLVRPGEVVLNMYAGAGLFSIIIAKHSRPSKVYSVDINPDAYKYMVENVRLNKVEGVVEPILGDAVRVIQERLAGSSDRVLMPYPDIALDHLPYAIMALRDGRGVVHVYLHVKAAKGEDHFEKAASLLSRRLGEIGVQWFNVANKRVVRMVGPRVYQVVLDVEVKSF